MPVVFALEGATNLGELRAMSDGKVKRLYGALLNIGVLCSPDKYRRLKEGNHKGKKFRAMCNMFDLELPHAQRIVKDLINSYLAYGGTFSMDYTARAKYVYRAVVRTMNKWRVAINIPPWINIWHHDHKMKSSDPSCYKIMASVLTHQISRFQDGIENVFDDDLVRHVEWLVQKTETSTKTIQDVSREVRRICEEEDNAAANTAANNAGNNAGNSTGNPVSQGNLLSADEEEPQAITAPENPQTSLSKLFFVICTFE